MDIDQYWAACVKQNADAMRSFFQPDAMICWHNTNERFTVEEFIKVNCEYPGEWVSQIERVIQAGDTLVTVLRIMSADGTQSHHAVSFFTLADNKIIHLHEYWGEDSPAPDWRQAMGIGSRIK